MTQEGERKPHLHISRESQRVIDIAEKEAIHLNHRWVTTAHLFLGLMQNDQIGGIMEKLNLKRDLSLARSTLRNLCGEDHSGKETSISPRVRTIIEHAADKALKEGIQEITPLHIWEALMVYGEGLVEGVLMSLKEPRKE